MATKAWYLLPIIFGIIGGIIMYFGVRNDDKEMAKKGLILGVIMFVVYFIIGFVIGGAGY